MSARCPFRDEKDGPKCILLRDHADPHRLSDGRIVPLSAKPWKLPRTVLLDENGHPVVPSESDALWVHSEGPVHDCRVVRELLRLRGPFRDLSDTDDRDTVNAGLSWRDRGRYLPQESDLSD